MNHYKPWLAALLTFLALSLFDALIGGSISTILRIGGWSAIDQNLNDVYHVNYAVVVAAALIWHYSHFKLIAPVLAITVLFLGYVEDTLFYCLVPLFNPAIAMLTKGEAFPIASGAWLPQHISGWIGWLGRSFLNKNIAFNSTSIMGINAVAVFIALFLFWAKEKINRRYPTS
jgi:hypothetical protein